MARRSIPSDIHQQLSKMQLTLGNFERRLTMLTSAVDNVGKKLSGLLEYESMKGPNQRGSSTLYIGTQATIMPAKLRSVSMTNMAATTETSIHQKMAENITGVIGLKEAVEIRHPVVKAIWLILFLVGIGATVYFIFATVRDYLQEPTVTRIKFQEQEAYEYPPIVLCNDAWFDVGKAKDLGLSVEGLKFALGYLLEETQKDKYPQPDNISQAKDEFLTIYSQHSFESLFNFFEAIAVDLKQEDCDIGFKSTISPSFCSNRGISVEKIFLGSIAMCYRFSLPPVEANSHFIHKRDSLDLKFEDRRQGLVSNDVLPPWKMYTTDDDDAYFTRPLHLYPSKKYWISIDSRQINSMNTPDSPCDPLKSAATCMKQCYSSFNIEWRNCHAFILVDENKNSPKKFCNFFDKDYSTGTNPSQQTIENLRICLSQCHKKCKRTIFEATVHDDYPINPPNQPNMSLVWINFLHNGMRDGEIMEVNEIPSYSSTELVTNVGGTLGLFIGGTLMTFAQLILFFANYIYEKRKAVKVAKQIFVTGGK